MQPLHDEQHGDAGAASVRVIDHGAVQVDQPLVLGQGPEAAQDQIFQSNDHEIVTFCHIEAPVYYCESCLSTLRPISQLPAFLRLMAVGADDD